MRRSPTATRESCLGQGLGGHFGSLPASSFHSHNHRLTLLSASTRCLISINHIRPHRCWLKHYPKQSFTMVADTPENLRLKQQSELQSQVRYKEEFEKNKGKGFSVVADTPELQRIKKTQDQISNIKYHEEFEKSRMGPSGGEGLEPERRDSQGSGSYRRPQEQQQPPHHIPTGAPVYQQPQQQQAAQSYGGYKEPAAPVSIQRSTPGGGGKRYRAVYDYSAADEDEVSFQDGDTIVNVQQIDDGWMYGTVERTGDTGMLPANYVEAI
uniref:LIM and SH3 protein 1 n=1 Tax=Equus asinus TaxID=9793 RepID=A0A9L0JR95_EQUAS